ncbi:MAG TPA: ABC transporter substrate-binding protein [Candidatus Limnocylindria bacterium]|nr:ABC transporter substrate-binding protein [Candidatus Limnocylindria bacterium]
MNANTRRLPWLGAWITALALLAACGATANPGAPANCSGPTTLRLGYFPNVAHAMALVGDRGGIFAEGLGEDASLQVHNFNAGGEAIEAIFNGGIDITYIGPNPAINGFIRSEGEAVRIIAGATSGGAFFVVREGIESAEDLRGLTVTSPALGNTQDVALRAWLADNGLATDAEGAGDVSITPLANAQILEGYIAGQLDGAWVPEPWATRLLQQGGHVLVDERDLWPDGRYVTTHLLVRTEFLAQNPELVRRFLEAHLRATDFVNDEPAEAQRLVSEGIQAITGSAMAPDVLATAWGNLAFTVDPIAGSLQESAEDAFALGFLPSDDLAGIYDLSLLNDVLSAAGRPQIAQP